MKHIRTCILALAGSLAVSPALAQDLTPEQESEAVAFAVSNSIFVLQHEIGHLFVGEFGLPVLGKEEDAADSLASITLLGQETEEASQTLTDAADGWYLSENAKAGETYEEADFYGEHSLDIQRAYQVVCLMVGADPEAFREVADEYGMDAERQEGCGFDYQQAAESWSGLLEPHLKGSAGGAGIAVTYEPGGDDYADIEDLLKENQFLESAAANVADTYALPRDMTFRATTCGEENAFYDPENAEIVFCYEMTAMFFDLIARHMLEPET